MKHIFITDFVFWEPVQQHEVLKVQLLAEIEKLLPTTQDQHRGNWMCEVNTEYFSQESKHTKYIDLITQAVYPAVDRLFSDLPLKQPKASTVTHIWYNRYGQRDYQEVHRHLEYGVSLSGIYLLELKEENKTVFFSHAASGSSLFPAEKRLVEAKEGDIVLFPAHLLHYVLPCEQTRTTVAFNIKCEF
jgi:hypothetical protein